MPFDSLLQVRQPLVVWAVRPFNEPKEWRY